MPSYSPRRSCTRAVTGIGTLGAVGYALAISFGAHAAIVVAFALSTPPVAAPAHQIDIDVSMLLPPPPESVEAPRPASLAEVTPEPPPTARRTTVSPAAVRRLPAPEAAAAAPAPAPETTAPPPSSAESVTPEAPPSAGIPIASNPLAASAPNVPPSRPAGVGSQPATGAPPSNSPAPSVIYAESEVDQAPHLLGEAHPTYPANALRAGAEGDVVLSLIVDRTGSVSEARVTRPVGHGFDAAALAAVQHLHFQPGRKQGAPVAVRVTWTCRFRLEP